LLGAQTFADSAHSKVALTIMDSTKSYLVYMPPKSNSHGHGVRAKNIIAATQMVIDAFKDSFNAKYDKNLQLTVNYNSKKEQEEADRTISRIVEFMGLPTRTSDAVVPMENDKSLTWEAVDLEMPAVLDYVNQINDDRFLPLSNYWISSFYSYGKSPEPSGSMMCSIESGRLFVRLLNVILPYTIESDQSYELLSAFQSKLPFKLNSKHFRKLGPSKGGYRRSKLDEKMISRIEGCLQQVSI
jgi:hypothetical protein